MLYKLNYDLSVKSNNLYLCLSVMGVLGEESDK